MVEVVNRTTDRLAEWRCQHTELAKELIKEAGEIHSLRMELREAVDKAFRQIRTHISHPPRPPSSHYWSLFGEYWHSFKLFIEKLQLVKERFSVPFEFDEGVLEEPESVDEEAWMDHFDLMDDALDSLRLGREYRSQLVTIVDLIDSIERLLNLQFPKARGTGAEFTKALQQLRQPLQEIRETFLTLLRKHHVSPIKLARGQYPPPETTRVISRDDDNSHDDIVISQIVTQGYLWQDKLLRKADVIVISRKGV
jgi:hypothetical protein